MSRHASASDLARLSAGDLSPGKARRIRAHLADCGQCQQVCSELANVSLLLASVQAPPIPAHLAARIETALAAESAQRVASEPASEGGRRDLPSRSRAGRRRPRKSSPLALRVMAAAAAVVAMAGIVFGLTRQQSPASSSSSGSASSGPAARVPGRPVAAPLYGPALRYQHSGRTDSVTPVATRTDFEPGLLRAQVRDTMLTARLTTPAPAGSGGGGATANAARAAPSRGTMTDEFGRVVQLAQLAACVARITPPGQIALLVDLARYHSDPATVIVTAAGGSSSSQVWVVGPACSSSDSDIVARDTLPQQ